MMDMPAAPLLSEAEIEARLGDLPGWIRVGQAIEKTFTFADFRRALSFVNAVADPADAQNHHPDVTIHWNKVTLQLWTHASGGLTERDFRLAASIDALTEGTDAEA